MPPAAKSVTVSTFWEEWKNHRKKSLLLLIFYILINFCWSEVMFSFYSDTLSLLSHTVNFIAHVLFTPEKVTNLVHGN